MAISISPELLAAQQGNYTPYIDLVFHDRDDNNTQDYSLTTDATNRIKDIQHHEKMYDGYGFIVLRNNDRSVVDLRGWWVEIGYGADTSDFGGSGNEFVKRPRLWVTNQLSISAPGVVVTQLILEDVWRKLRRHLVRTLGTPPMHPKAFTDQVIYQIIKTLLEDDFSANERSYMAATLDALGDQDDGIINTLIPYFNISIAYMESSLEIIQRALNLTESYLRARAGLNFEIRYPQDSDAVDATYYSDQVPYFHEYVESESVLVPNHVIFYGNIQEDDFNRANLLTSVAKDVAANEDEVVVIKELADVTSQGDLDIYTNAYLNRTKNRRVAGRLIIRHDCRREIHDKIQILDSRGL